jgi:Flp pilus assembly protein TadG
MPGISRRPDDKERGSAVVDFVLIMIVLIPLFLGIMQVGLVLHIRNTLTAAASDGARYGATLNGTPEDGALRARQQIQTTLSGRFASNVRGGTQSVGGSEVVVVRVEADVPPLGLWGPSLHLDVTGHATEESQ